MAKKIVITGAGGGLGRALARRLGSEGHHLFLIGRTLSKIEAVASEVGPSAHPIFCDIVDPGAVDEAFAAIGAISPRIDVLINNAAFFEPVQLVEATNGQIADALDINLAGPIYCTRAAMPLMGWGGHIINVSSRGVVVPVAMHGLYQAAKAGLERFTSTLSQEITPMGIRVTLVRASKMFDEDSRLKASPEVAKRFREESLKLGIDNQTAAISRFSSVANPIAALLDLPDDVNIPEMTFEARHANR